MQTDKLDIILEKLNNMEALLTAAQAENKQLKEEAAERDKVIGSLKQRLNHLEQHHRSWSIRINNVSLADLNENDPPAIIERVYNEALLPILRGAVTKQAISTVPPCYDMIEMAHTIGKGNSDRPKPIIVRFFNRNIKSILFKFRKEFAVRTATASASSAPPRYRYPFNDDLTRDTYIKMKELNDDKRVEFCWSTAGQLRVKMSDSGVIKRVFNVYATNDEILR